MLGKRLWSIALLMGISCCFSCKMNKNKESSLGANGAFAKLVTEEHVTLRHKEIADRLVNVSSKQELALLISEMRRDYASYPADLQFLAAFYLPMAKLQSIIYRLDGLFMRSLIGNRNDTTHSFNISILKQMATGINTFLPTQSWQAGFKYFTEPLEGAEATNRQFQKFRDFQSFMLKEILPELEALYSNISQINFSYSGEKPRQAPPSGYIVFDNKVLYGTINDGAGRIDPFPDNMDRFILIGEAERKAVLAVVAISIHNLLVTCSLNLDHVLDVADQLARHWGFDNDIMGFRTIEGLTSIKRTNTIQSFVKSGNFLKVENREMLKDAYTRLQDGVTIAYEAWKEVKSRGVDDVSATEDIFQNFLFLNPARLIPWSRMTDAGFANILNMLNNDTASVRSIVTGEVTDIKLKDFYYNPPANLAEFLPIRFDQDLERKEGGITFRNYYHGTPLEWRYSLYARFFPSIEKIERSSDGADIRPTLRVVSQSWGGWMVATPMLLAL